MIDIESMSDDELMEAWTAAGEQLLQSIKETVKEYSAEFHRREVEKSAQQKLAAMTDAEREALGLPPAIVAEAEGIETQESVSNG